MILEQVAALWNQLIDLTSKFVIPDWGALIGLLPILVVLGVVGPIVTLLVLGWLGYGALRPRTGVKYAEGAVRIPVEADGSIAWPVGLPYCLGDRLAFDSGATRCTECKGDLAVVCPMCGLGRDAGIRTCGNCGLVLKVEPRARVLRPSGPPPGGATLA